MLLQKSHIVVCGIIWILFASGCASVDKRTSHDPLEPMNRAVFAFNDTADTWVLRPVAKGYRAVTPDPVENGISNFFNNLLEIRNVFNDVLQWKWRDAGVDSGRFLVNSTVGIAGIFDVAKYMNLPKDDGEDFGQTLGVWGVPKGAYLVIPLLGPSNVRDGASLPVDWYLQPVGYIDHVPTRNSTTAFEFIVDRAGVLDAEGFVSGDRYTFIREAYLQRREYLVNDGVVEDDFDDFGSDDYEDDF